MRAKDIAFIIVIAALWYFSAFYIAAPHDIHNELFNGFGMTHEQHHLLGILLLVVSLIVVLIWALMSTEEKAEAAQQVPSKAPA